ncbi:hypothetical protein [Hypericibacter sp.]
MAKIQRVSFRGCPWMQRVAPPFRARNRRSGAPKAVAGGQE